MTDLIDLQARYREFVEARDWTRFHTPKNAAEAVSVEAGELLVAHCPFLPLVSCHRSNRLTNRWMLLSKKV
jgi:hypothetical protein